jgi:hypothetical protein
LDSLHSRGVKEDTVTLGAQVSKSGHLSLQALAFRTLVNDCVSKIVCVRDRALRRLSPR